MPCSISCSQKLRVRIHSQFILNLKPRFVILYNIVIAKDINPSVVRPIWEYTGRTSFWKKGQTQGSKMVVPVCVCVCVCVCFLTQNEMAYSEPQSLGRRKKSDRLEKHKSTISIVPISTQLKNLHQINRWPDVICCIQTLGNLSPLKAKKTYLIWDLMYSISVNLYYTCM